MVLAFARLKLVSERESHVKKNPPKKKTEKGRFPIHPAPI